NTRHGGATGDAVATNIHQPNRRANAMTGGVGVCPKLASAIVIVNQLIDGMTSSSSTS
ncbi:hypothetical protein A2U01_0097427, partial [Trifolium medium]|nr:hypothetical protein [Trifolium medium]